jgi:hypothetical protein
VRRSARQRRFGRARAQRSSRRGLAIERSVDTLERSGERGGLGRRQVFE